MRWLVFRLMFMSGVVKLASKDPTWWNFSALDFHYETQPLPTWTSWYIHQMPAWFHALSVGFMFYAELVAPVLILGTRGMRRVAFASLVTLAALDRGNRKLWVLQLAFDRSLHDHPGRPRLGSAAAALLAIAGRSYRSAPRMIPRDRAASAGRWPGESSSGIGWWRLARRDCSAAHWRDSGRESTAPFPFPWLADRLEPLRSTNSYGLFAVMTTERPEIIVEGSNDGESWKPYHFRWKPDESWIEGHDSQPRTCLGSTGSSGSPPSLATAARNLVHQASSSVSWQASPRCSACCAKTRFPTQPPRFVRARLYRYKFTGWGSRDWWDREDQGLFCPPIEKRQKSVR